MGNKFEIEVWTNEDGPFEYKHFWGGESFIQSLLQLRKAKKKGYGCVTLHWRG